MDLINATNISLVVLLLTCLFNVYQYFKKPQIDIEKKVAVSESEVNGKAQILAQQLQWEKESNERRFKEMADHSTTVNTLAQNHISHVDAKVDVLTNLVSTMNNNLSKEIAILSTKIDERFSHVERRSGTDRRKS